MRGGSNSRGYTIVESMIFLAVSGLMFVMAASFVSGKQAKSEFRHSMDEINSQVQQIINDVSNGFYPSTENFQCTAGATGAPSIVGGTNVQGSNLGCTFIGKVIQFGVHGTNRSGYNVYSIAGRQYAPSPPAPAPRSLLPTNFAEAIPTVVYNNSPLIDTTDRKQLKWLSQATRMRNGATDINGIGFFTTFGSYETSNTLKSGSQSVIFVPITGPLGETELDMRNRIESATGVTDANIDPNPDILVCFDGGNGQFGTLNIGGGNGQRLTSRVQVYESLPTVC